MFTLKFQSRQSNYGSNLHYSCGRLNVRAKGDNLVFQEKRSPFERSIKTMSLPVERKILCFHFWQCNFSLAKECCLAVGIHFCSNQYRRPGKYAHQPYGSKICQKTLSFLLEFWDFITSRFESYLEIGISMCEYLYYVQFLSLSKCDARHTKYNRKLGLLSGSTLGVVNSKTFSC